MIRQSRHDAAEARAAVARAELVGSEHKGTFWLLVPECVPREFAPSTRPLIHRVEAGLRRMAGS